MSPEAALWRFGSVLIHPGNVDDVEPGENYVSVFAGTRVEGGPGFVGVVLDGLAYHMTFENARELAKLLNRAADKAEAQR